MTTKKTIRELIFQSTKWMRLLAIIPLVVSIVIYTNHLFTYQRAVNNIHRANEISTAFRTQVIEDVWGLVYGQVTPAVFSQENIITDLREDITDMADKAQSQAEHATLMLTLEAVDSMEMYVATIKENIVINQPVAKNENVMLQVESSNLLVLDILQEFIEVEINFASSTGSEVMNSVIVLSIIEGFVLLATFIFSKRIKHSLTKNVEMPLNELMEMSDQISKGHLNYRVSIPPIKELAALSNQMNGMAENLNVLLEENAKKQYHLAQSEMRVLQAQITPHFIYNSLDAILALAEQGDMAAVQKMTYSLSDFFRISLSKGRDWITLEKEIKHISDYLLILKMRYGDMLTYDISVSEELHSYTILKMLLQPIVENAVYHGTKAVRRVGLITVTAYQEDDMLCFSIADNGKGVPPEKLNEIRAELNKGVETEFSEGYGLYNVNKRLLLYYGEKARLTFDSQLNHGTTVTIRVPLHELDQEGGIN